MTIQGKGQEQRERERERERERDRNGLNQADQEISTLPKKERKKISAIRDSNRSLHN
jgi:hypothetical protein